eukprot:tig00001545_g9341.t1
MPDVIIDIASLALNPGKLGAVIGSILDANWDASTQTTDICSVAATECDENALPCCFCRAGRARLPPQRRATEALPVHQSGFRPRFGLEYFHCLACGHCLPMGSLEHDCSRGAIDSFCAECDGGFARRSGICPTCWSEAHALGPAECDALPPPHS